MSRLLVWITVVSCGGLPAENREGEVESRVLVGPVGNAGPDGRPGPTPGYHWVDSTGFAVTTAEPLVWIDPDTGWVWAVDAETGLIEPVPPFDLALYYTDGACTSGERVLAQRPKTPFAHDGTGGSLVVRRADDKMEEACANSYLQGVTCKTITCREGPWNLTADLVATGLTDPPVSPWVGPLHLER